MKARLQRLRAEVGSDRAAFADRLGELEQLDLSQGAPAPGELARAAVALHHAYGAVEALLSRVARTLEEEGDASGPDWHQGLLLAMSLPIEGIRPAILSPESLALLRHLLAFRHFFRHAYAAPLDAERLALLRRDALELGRVLAPELDRLDTFLHDLAASAED